VVIPKGSQHGTGFIIFDDEICQVHMLGGPIEDRKLRAVVEQIICHGSVGDPNPCYGLIKVRTVSTNSWIAVWD